MESYFSFVRHICDGGCYCKHITTNKYRHIISQRKKILVQCGDNAFNKTIQ